MRVGDSFSLSREQLSNVWARILARCVKTDDCLVWQGYVTPKGYGQILVYCPEVKLPGVLVYVHRVAYVQAYGQIPPGLTIDHVKIRGCVHKACCEGSHLEAVTKSVNTRRRYRHIEA